MYDQLISTDLVPLKMCSANIVLDQFEPGWTLAQTENCELPQPRQFEHYIEFENPFSSMPVVQASVAGFDIDNCDTARLSVHTTDISPAGFRIIIETWRHSRVYMVEISWMALGSA